MVLASIDLWDIVDGSEKAPPFNMDPKFLKEYQRFVKKIMSIIGISLTDNQFTYIKSCKGHAEVWTLQKALFIPTMVAMIYCPKQLIKRL